MSEEKSNESVQEQTKIENKVPETLNHEQALTVLINAARIGQEKGAYSLEEAELISKAIKTFVVLVPDGPQQSGN